MVRAGKAQGATFPNATTLQRTGLRPESWGTLPQSRREAVQMSLQPVPSASRHEGVGRASRHEKGNESSQVTTLRRATPACGCCSYPDNLLSPQLPGRANSTKFLPSAAILLTCTGNAASGYEATGVTAGEGFPESSTECPSREGWRRQLYSPWSPK